MPFSQRESFSVVPRWGTVSVCLLAIALSNALLVRSFTLPWPPLKDLMIRKEGMQDLALVISGFRRVAADIAWVQMLQFVGTDDMFDDSHYYHTHDHDGGRHEPPKPVEKADLKDRALRVTRIDPFFGEAYLFAAGILAWSPALDRPDEAMDILREGAQAMPEYWPIQTYIAAILYKKQTKVEEMTALMEAAIVRPNCPTVAKSVLANFYKSQRRYADSIRVWTVILNNPNDAWYHDHATRQIELLLRLSSKPAA